MRQQPTNLPPQFLDKAFRTARQPLVCVLFPQNLQFLSLIALGKPGRPVFDLEKLLAPDSIQVDQDCLVPCRNAPQRSTTGRLRLYSPCRPEPGCAPHSALPPIGTLHPAVRKVLPLPKVPFPPPCVVDALGVTHVQRLEHSLQTVVAGWNCNEVDMVCHEAVSEYFDLVLLAVVLEQ